MDWEKMFDFANVSHAISPDSSPHDIVIGVINVLLLLAIIIPNLSILKLIWRKPELPMIFEKNLLVSNSMFAAVSLFHMTLDFVGFRPFGQIGCIFVVAIRMLFFVSCYLIVILINFGYCLLLFQTKRLYNKRTLNIICVIVWVVSTIFGIGIGISTYEYSYDAGLCLIGPANIFLEFFGIFFILANCIFLGLYRYKLSKKKEYFMQLESYHNLASVFKRNLIVSLVYIISEIIVLLYRVFQFKFVVASQLMYAILIDMPYIYFPIAVLLFQYLKNEAKLMIELQP